ncbi:dihydroxyacetone kinase [Plesiocystis pacifica SIR-1]|uniref:Dihydroxyacetone kinase n=1 Tax=Plesiocystis pacifica SIR-1 TaxID=391625 RepID=A6GB72_9BACT|nr:dihydroxyacetone kinase subunit DhaK [Plesiocystis pacifica]EDM76869.1 dihydroxyacetone kinase [Plesiocystis pacifica SIR-1]
MSEAVKRFINGADSIVTEALDGLVCLGHDRVRLDGFPHVKVVRRASLDPAKVALVSGGGAGHEPAHAGLVGAGMLSAAVSGEIFASPSVEAVHAGILASTGPAGCLLIIKNYTGDRLNFGLAAERARAAGLRVEAVIVADDVALPDAVSARGVAGTVLVHKIAGHLAERGASLEQVAEQARAVAGELRSIGLSLETCTLPGQPKRARLGPTEAELGLGIHGEPGLEVIAHRSARELVAQMLARLEPTLPADDRPLAALVNNLGAVPPIEMSLLTRELLVSPLGQRVTWVVGPAPLMTSLDMNGLSISLLPLDPERLEALRSPSDAPGWSPIREVVREGRVVAMPAGLGAQSKEQPSSDPQTEATLATILTCLEGLRGELDSLDAKIGDGDTGSTLAKAAAAIRADFESLPFAEPPALLAALGRRLSTVMGGSSGVLASILCTAAGEAMGRGASWVEGLSAGLERVMEYGGARPGDRTFVDALAPALDALRSGADLPAAASAARAGADQTAAMTRARAGRAAYLSAASLEGVADPGAVAVAAAFEALAEATLA